MDPPHHHRTPFHRPSHPRLHNILPPLPSHHVSHRTSNSTPVSSPGLFSPTLARPNMSQPGSETATPSGLNSPYLHPLQGHKVRE